MDRNKISFYGTPLNKCLNDVQAEDDGSSSFKSRKARLDYQQTVRDGQGRQRFHGAFTGGFSAGYHNTVDSAEGFQPRQFVTNRRIPTDAGSKFTHKPEDYMDEEDLGEFGIAPRKIRVANQYSSGSSFGPESSLVRLLKPTVDSIGKQILERMNTGAESNTNCARSDRFQKSNNLIKNDFHGLGYTPLEGSKFKSNSRESINPLVAVLGGGKKIKISGEAFGSGVLDDDEDYPDTTEAYGYDDIRNYEFKSNSRSRAGQRSDQVGGGQHDCDHGLLPGFVLAKSLTAMKLCDVIKDQYPLPTIPHDWKMPMRAEPYLPPAHPNSSYDKLSLQTRHSGSIFSKKFTGSSELANTEDIQTKAGLLLYSDLKAVKPSSSAQESLQDTIGDTLMTEATLTRVTVEWRPCSLLCKHFNVPNPFPDNAYCGVKPSLARNEIIQATSDNLLSEASQRPATIELKRSIFDVVFACNRKASAKQDQRQDPDSDNSEDEPQIIELERPLHNSSIDGDPDVVVIAPIRQEPELIVLTTSSESSSHSSTDCKRNNSTTDSYGPDLPPTLKTLMDFDHHSSSTSRRRGKRKKRKKHKKAKRN